jgi:hypothetical protein
VIAVILRDRGNNVLKKVNNSFHLRPSGGASAQQPGKRNLATKSKIWAEPSCGMMVWMLIQPNTNER